MIRVISLPACLFIDQGGIPVFEDDTCRLPMSIDQKLVYYSDNETIFIAAIFDCRQSPEKLERIVE